VFGVDARLRGARIGYDGVVAGSEKRLQVVLALYALRSWYMSRGWIDSSNAKQVRDNVRVFKAVLRPHGGVAISRNSVQMKRYFPKNQMHPEFKCVTYLFIWYTL
jgi:hypothetical protein